MAKTYDAIIIGAGIIGCSGFFSRRREVNQDSSFSVLGYCG